MASRISTHSFRVTTINILKALAKQQIPSGNYSLDTIRLTKIWSWPASMKISSLDLATRRTDTLSRVTMLTLTAKRTKIRTLTPAFNKNAKLLSYQLK
jgi:hypothetical protein